MRKTLLASAACLGLAFAAPAFAQGTASSTASPPAPNMSAGTPQPTNSLPAGAGTSAPRPYGGVTPGGGSNFSAGTNATGTMPSESTGTAGTMAGSNGEMSGSGATMHGRRAMRHRGMRANDEMTETGARPGHEPGVGESEPMAHHASNIDRADTHSEIAPRLPAPPVGENAGPERYLAAAQKAIRAHRTGEAQEALERAETRLLDRSAPAGAANAPDQGPAIQHINDALHALAGRNYAAAEQATNQAMSASGGGTSMNGRGMSGEGMGRGTGMSGAPMNGQDMSGQTMGNQPMGNQTMGQPQSMDQPMPGSRMGGAAPAR